MAHTTGPPYTYIYAERDDPAALAKLDELRGCCGAFLRFHTPVQFRTVRLHAHTVYTDHAEIRAAYEAAGVTVHPVTAPVTEPVTEPKPAKEATPKQASSTKRKRSTPKTKRG